MSAEKSKICIVGNKCKLRAKILVHILPHNLSSINGSEAKITMRFLKSNNKIIRFSREISEAKAELQRFHNVTKSIESKLNLRNKASVMQGSKKSDRYVYDICLPKNVRSEYKNDRQSCPNTCQAAPISDRGCEAHTHYRSDDARNETSTKKSEGIGKKKTFLFPNEAQIE
ncbi:hypothetical protein NPIL_303881 [Nephila pilipes]|uniref:Uncharacterized protein n=1 Tax=Nephila pilipes TaxID=299642 RepID=A0A8X6N8W9_NEPPI|nr:hypothetical protein NPIL_303881 [Nephila pilipes]